MFKLILHIYIYTIWAVAIKELYSPDDCEEQFDDAIHNAKVEFSKPDYDLLVCHAAQRAVSISNAGRVQVGKTEEHILLDQSQSQFQHV